MMKVFLIAAVVSAAFGNIVSASAQVYPSRPITVVVPFPAGGPTDLLSRILGDRMKLTLGQPIIVDNVSGAGGSIGVGRTLRAAPDGYTLSFGQWASHVGSGAVYPQQYDVLRDLEPVSLVANAPLWIIGKNTLPANDLKNLIGWLKANPDKASAATVGAGSASHLCGVYFQSNTGTRFQFVPYRGGSPAMQDLLAGTVDLMCDYAANSLSQVQAGKIRAYAVMAKTRWFAAPDVPTVDEAGLPGLYLSFWHGLWAPKGTPSNVIDRLNAAVVDALADPAVRQQFTELGQEIPPREQQSPEALGAHHRAEIEKWWPIIKAANIKTQ